MLHRIHPVYHYREPHYIVKGSASRSDGILPDISNPFLGTASGLSGQ